MMTKKPDFTFKQFYINHDHCAMKVGTDGILLGAWAKLSGTQFLDVGTGTGLVAIMLAQRSSKDAQVTAIEIDKAAYLQAIENVQNSPWHEKIQVFHQDLIYFDKTCSQKFDVIVSNPPYFKQGVNCRDQQRKTARYTSTLNHLSWLEHCHNLLNENGLIHFILPYTEGKILQKQTALYCAACCEVITKKGKKPNRLLLSFTPQPCETKMSQLTIYDEQNQYTEEFIQLTKAFYLKF